MYLVTISNLPSNQTLSFLPFWI